MDVLSAFRPCGRDLVEFFNSTGWAFFVQVDYFRVARDTIRIIETPRYVP